MRPKRFFEPMVRLAQTMRLSYTDTNTILQTDQNKIPHYPCHLGVPLGARKMISKAMVRSVKQCSYIASIFALSTNGPKRAST